MSFCLAGAGVAVSIAAQTFSLSWTHTIEKMEWREDWRVDGEDLVLEKAGVKGSGAGMEPAPDARLEGGLYVWRPETREVVLTLRRDPDAGDWTLCTEGRCEPIAAWIGVEVDPVEIRAAACEKRPR